MIYDSFGAVAALKLSDNNTRGSPMPACVPCETYCYIAWFPMIFNLIFSLLLPLYRKFIRKTITLLFLHHNF